METKPKRKATRRIKKFDFSSDAATVSLVGEAVGGAANGYTTLLTKSNKQVSEDFIRKASEITVTMEITEYLRRFFGMWGTDAELLARSLGFTTAGMEKAQVEMQEEMLEENEPAEYPDWDSKPGDKDYEKWMNEKLQSIQVMKQLYTAENIEDALLSVSEEDYIKFLQDQEVVEKALLELDSNSAKAVGEASTNVDVENGGGTSPVAKQKEKGKKMTDKVQVVEQEVEVIAKSEFDSIQKAFEVQQEELKKALELVNDLQKEKQEAIYKSRAKSLSDAFKDQAKAEVVMKAIRADISEEEFAAVVKAVSEVTAQIEKSEMFKEIGASAEDTSDKVDPLTRLIKAKYNKE